MKEREQAVKRGGDWLGRSEMGGCGMAGKEGGMVVGGRRRGDKRRDGGEGRGCWRTRVTYARAVAASPSGLLIVSCHLSPSPGSKLNANYDM